MNRNTISYKASNHSPIKHIKYAIQQYIQSPHSIY